MPDDLSTINSPGDVALIDCDSLIFVLLVPIAVNVAVAAAAALTLTLSIGIPLLTGVLGLFLRRCLCDEEG